MSHNYLLTAQTNRATQRVTSNQNCHRWLSLVIKAARSLPVRRVREWKEEREYDSCYNRPLIMYKHPLSLFCSSHFKVGHRVHDALLFCLPAPSRDSGWREMVVNEVMIGKMIERRLKFPSSLNHASSSPEKTLAANGVRSHAWEFEAWVMLAVGTADTDWKQKQHFGGNVPLDLSINWSVPRLIQTLWVSLCRGNHRWIQTTAGSSGVRGRRWVDVALEGENNRDIKSTNTGLSKNKPRGH